MPTHGRRILSRRHQCLYRRCQLRDQSLSIVRPTCRLESQHAAEYHLQGLRQRRVQPRGIHVIPGVSLGGIAGLHGRRLADRTFVEHATQREDIRPPVDRLPVACLLGRHVHGRAQRLARPGHPQIIMRPARDAEVEQLGLAQIRPWQEQVRRLEVPVDNAEPVRRGQGTQHAAAQARRCHGSDGPAGKTILQGLAIQPLHDEIGLALQGRTMGHVADNGWMGKRGQRLCLAKQSLCGVVSLLAQHLHRHRLPVQEIPTAEHHPHAPAADQRLNLEALTKTPPIAHHTGRHFLGFE